MKHYITLCILIPLFTTILPDTVSAQGPMGRDFGIGFSVGEPTAVSARFWISRANSWDLALGSSAVGNPHIHADYLWHFNDAFNSRIFTLYAGVGGIVGFGDKDRGIFIRFKGDKDKDRWYYDDDTDMAVAAKGVFGLNVIPRNTPLDIFLELNPVLGISPGFGFDIQPALGIRFYP
ncbi:MAG: hypothetical protein RRA94_12280 [Bacteroidota bacterium]|nr:hypothetical protein [Bacteroidota bacterium]